MEFNIDDYKGKYAMLCKTEEEAKDFCNYLHSVGRFWTNGDSYIKSTEWVKDLNDIVYYFNEGLNSSYKYAKKQNYTILEWSNFMNGKFTKKDLKTGDVVKFRDGHTGIVNGELDMIITQTCWQDLDGYETDLTSGYGNEQFDIIAVRRPNVKGDCQFIAFDYNWGILVYERKEVEEMTLEQVCKLLGKEIKIVK